MSDIGPEIVWCTGLDFFNDLLEAEQILGKGEVHQIVAREGQVYETNTKGFFTECMPGMIALRIKLPHKEINELWDKVHEINNIRRSKERGE